MAVSSSRRAAAPPATPRRTRRIAPVSAVAKPAEIAVRNVLPAQHLAQIHRRPSANWTEELQFVTALTKGTSPGGQHYYPAFPYATYAHMRLDDARDLFAYLRTLSAAQGRAPAHEVPFPFNIRRLVGGWKLLFLRRKALPVRTPRNRRRVEPRRLSGERRGPLRRVRHSPHGNILGGIKSGQRFAGRPRSSKARAGCPAASPRKKA